MPRHLFSFSARLSAIKRGDVVVEFDRQQQYKDFLDKQAAYLSWVGQVAQKVAAEQAARAKDDSEQSLVNAQVGYQLAVIAVQHATGDLLGRFHVEIRGLAR